jgi:hypothetical protein
MSTMIEPFAAGLRTRCRRCQYVLPVPSEHRQAFCCRGCHRQFFAAHCRVCDKPSPNGRLHAKGCSYAHRQNPELYAFKPIQKPSDVGLEPKRARDERNPYKTSLKARAKSWGPTLSDDEFWLAAIPLHSADKANARRANARAGAEPALGRPKVIFGPDTPPLNILGGHRFPAGPAIAESLLRSDLAEPQFTEAA